ncbi:phosphoribosyltransferase [Candidatus Falkowbacteria bacterium]|nr:phosphoribosyltransferase [Candidatus Falkowbacteria bacterium]
MFKNREDAGQKLALALEKYKDKNAIVLAIPRGGIEVGYWVAKHLNADLSVLVSRKLPQPNNPETGFGAIAEDGSVFLYPGAESWLSEETRKKIIEEQKKEILRRVEIFRNGKPLPEIKNRTVILVDDGIAMGSTVRAAAMLCKNKKAGKIVIAAPVAGPETAEELQPLVDEVVILEKPTFFQAVAQVYENWRDVPFEEAQEILKKWKRT